MLGVHQENSFDVDIYYLPLYTTVSCYCQTDYMSCNINPEIMEIYWEG